MAAIERMGTHKGHKGGSVVNISSIYGLINIPLIPVYNATKHAVVSFVRSMKVFEWKIFFAYVKKKIEINRC